VSTLDIYLAAARASHPAADWAIDQLLRYGPGVLLCCGMYALVCTYDAARDRIRIHRMTRRLEHLANHPSHRTRKED
jgi:hypothetical protein